MQLTLTPNVPIELAFKFARDTANAEGLGEYHLTGPATPVAMLKDTGKMQPHDQYGIDVQGKLSPVAPLTMPDDQRACTGIPVAATHFAFAYPSTSGGESMEGTLEELDLADERWAFFLLVGGFCYFVEDEKTKEWTLLQCNALVLVPSEYTMDFEGPFEPHMAALNYLKQNGRQVDVTLDALEEQGFAAFGWVLPSEKPGGHAVCDTDYPLGGFMYEMASWKDPSRMFFKLMPPTDKTVAEFNRLINDTGRKGFFLTRALSTMRREYNDAKQEEKEMNQMSATATNDGGNKGFASTFSKVIRPASTPLVGSIATAFCLMALGFVHRQVMEVAATLLYYSCFVFSVWVPFRDTGALSVLASNLKYKRRVTALLVLIPISITVIEIIALAVAESPVVANLYGLATDEEDEEGEAAEPVPVRESFDLAIEVIGALGTYLLVPLFLYHVRVLISRDLGNAKSGETSVAKRELLKHKTSARLVLIGQSSGEDEPAERTPVQPMTAVAPAPAALSRQKTGKMQVQEMVEDVGDDVIEGFNQGVSAVSKIINKGVNIIEESVIDGGGDKLGGPTSPSMKSILKTSANVAHFTPAKFGRKSSRVYPGGPEPTPESQKEARIRRAATKLQARMRMLIARKRYAKELERRREWLCRFHRPIFFASLFDILGSNIVLELNRQGYLTVDGGPSSDWTLYSLFFTLPSFLVVLWDQRKANAPRFSIAHGIFLVAVLYRMAFKGKDLDATFYTLIRNSDFAQSLGSAGENVAVTGTMVCHFAIFILVTALGKMTLSLVSAKNASLHLLFPFQMFDFLFLYVFFAMRTVKVAPDAFWVVQQIVLQVNIVGRNSGITDAIVRRQSRIWCRCLLGPGQLKKADPNDDPIFRLQSLARLAIQYDLADLTSLVLTPAVVTLFVWRDGYFTLQNTSILVEACDIGRLWTRFIILLVIKPFFSWIARCIMIRTMRKTLLGKTTIHGTSAIAANIIAKKRILSGGKKTEGGSPRKSQATNEFDDAQADILAKFGLGATPACDDTP